MASFNKPNSTTNELSTLKLSKEDEAFISEVYEEITESYSIPLQLPIKRLPNIIKRAAQWFYKEDMDSSEIKHFLIKKCDLPERTPNGNLEVCLPPPIIDIKDIKTSSKGYGGSKLIGFRTSEILTTNVLASSSGIGGSRSNRFGGNRDEFTEYFTRLYEYNQLRTLFKKGQAFDYNPNTRTLNLLGNVEGDLLVQTYCGIPLCALYKDPRFFDYVVAKSLKAVKKIIATFGFSYIGNVQINIDQIEKDADERIKEIEEEIKEEGDGSGLFLVF